MITLNSDVYFPLRDCLAILLANFPGGPGLAGTKMTPFWSYLS